MILLVIIAIKVISWQYRVIMTMSSMLFAPYDSRKGKMSLYFERFASQYKEYSIAVTEQVNKFAGSLTNAFVHSVGNSYNGWIETSKKLERGWRQSVARVKIVFHSKHKYDSNTNKTNMALENQDQVSKVMSVDAKPCVVNIAIQAIIIMAEIDSGAYANIMSQKVYRRLPMVKVLKQTSDKLYTANGTNLTVTGTDNIHTELASRKCPLQFYIVQNDLR